MDSKFFDITCKVTVRIPREDIWPYDGSVTNDEYTQHIIENPDGNLMDFSLYNPVISEVKVLDGN